MQGAPSILLVDDRPENLLALEAVLEPLAVECVRAGSGAEALRKLLREDFAAILLDVQMPDMDGFETASIIKRRRRSRDTPIIFITANERDPATVAHGFEVGAIDYITKPFDAALLRAKVQAMVSLHSKEAELRASEARFRTSFEHAPIGVALLSPDGRWLEVNVALSKMLGRSAAAMIQAPPFHVTEEGVFEQMLLGAGGATVWANLHVSLVRDAEGEPLHLICQVEDITERKREEESLGARIAYLAYHDELTGLPNRAMFREHLELALARADRNATAMAVLFLDLNRFKLVNDSLGHAAGDELLRQAAARIARAVRASDLVAREGGDEFIVLLADLDPETAPDVAHLVAAGIHEALGNPFEISGSEFYIGTSVGIALYPATVGERPDGEALLKHADAAMYEAKQAGTPTAIYSAPAGEPLERLALATRLRKAVDGMDFVLSWSPIVDLHTESVAGMEALISWRDSERGWVPQSELAELVEEMGMIDRVGGWVLGEAAKRQVEWRREGRDLEVAVNISSRQLWQRGGAEKLIAQISESGGDPERFVLGVAEVTAARTADRSAAALATLRAAGVRIAIDDFAHSPLTSLARMEFDVLKIHRSLVEGADAPEGQTVITAIVQLARNLGIWPMADGIETRRQFEILRNAGCRFGQGRLFARPMAAEDVPDFARGFQLASLNLNGDPLGAVAESGRLRLP